MLNTQFKSVVLTAAISTIIAHCANATPVTALASDSLVEASSVGVHLGVTGSGYGGVYQNRFPEVRDKLVELGVRNVRDGNSTAATISRMQELGALGIKTIYVLDANGGTKANSTYWANGGNYVIDDFIKNQLGVNNIAALELPNELNLFYIYEKWHNASEPLSNDPASSLYWGEYIKAVAQDTYATMKGDPATANIPIIGPSFSNEASYHVAGDLSAYVDYGNVHHYLAGRHPGTGGWGNNGYGSIDWVYNYCAAVTASGKPVAMTEGGYSTATSGGTSFVNETIHGKYLPRLLFNHFNKGTRWISPYEFINRGTNLAVSEDNFGLLRNDTTLSPKPAYTALKSVLNLLKDQGPAFTPAALDYTLSGSTSNIRQTLLQKRDGDFYLCLWIEKSCYDPNTGVVTTIPNQSITLTVPANIGTATVYSLDDTSALSSAAALISSGQISLSIPDKITIVKLTPAAANGTGLRGQYYAGNNFNNLVTARIDPTVNFNWGSGALVTGSGTDNYTVRWVGEVQAAQTGAYTFTTTTDDGARLWVNNMLLVDKFVSQSGVAWSGTINLTAGVKYPLTMEFLELEGNASAKLEWLRPGQTVKEIVPQIQLYPAPISTIGTGTGLKGQYYSGNNFNTLLTTRTDPTVNFNWSGGSAMSSVGPDNFSVRWTGQIQALASGNYTFTTTTDDGVRLYIGDLQTPLIDKWLNQNATWSVTKMLVAGQKYDIQMDYYESTGGATAKLQWIHPDQTGLQIVPQSQFYPAP